MILIKKIFKAELSRDSKLITTGDKYQSVHSCLVHEILSIKGERLTVKVYDYENPHIYEMDKKEFLKYKIKL